MAVEVAGLRLPTPLIAASGTFGYGDEYREVADYDCIGAISVKGLYLEPREGCPPPRIWETPSGMLNAIGLQEVGIRRFLAEKLPAVRALGKIVIANICGSSLEEYGELSKILDQAEGVSAIEVNISCPERRGGRDRVRVRSGHGGAGHRSGAPGNAAAGDSQAQPQRERHGRHGAAGSRRRGADAVSLINTIPAMAVDVETRRPRLANVRRRPVGPGGPSHRGAHGVGGRAGK